MDENNSKGIGIIAIVIFFAFVYLADKISNLESELSATETRYFGPKDCNYDFEEAAFNGRYELRRGNYKDGVVYLESLESCK